MSDSETTPRGFRVYSEFKDQYDQTIRIQESSNVCGGIWIFCFPTKESPVIIKAQRTPLSMIDRSNFERNHVPHLTLENARELIDALERAIEHQEKSTRIWRKKDVIE